MSSNNLDTKAAPTAGDKPAPAPQPAGDKVSFFLNDKETTVPKGWTVMQAAHRDGVAIPHFCWHPGLPIAGVCRFCLVKVEGRPKLEIACNLQATPGMKVYTNQAEVQDAHKWALEFHLVNHPLDCPVCDQAGECKLQDFYMEVGKYKSQMERPKVLKPKALDVGSELVLDTERCILCDRCVRFEENVTKTGALGIFNRGDRAVIGTYPDKKIEHNYQGNLVDICPVGAFTSRDFRFKQRVWFLKDKPAVCPGCSTGCHVDVYAKPEVRTYFRVKPRHAEANGHWMCDTGRKTYTHLNQEQRLRFPRLHDGRSGKRASLDEAVADLAVKLLACDPSDIALLLSPSYTVEEFNALFAFFVAHLGVKKVFQWREPSENTAAFDGILYRGDHNANTKGLAEALRAHQLPAEIKNGFDQAMASGAKVLIALAPELAFQYPSLAGQIDALGRQAFVSLWTVDGSILPATSPIAHALPLKGFAEKRGTFLNHEGKPGVLATPFPSAVEDARDVGELVKLLSEVMARTASSASIAGKSKAGQQPPMRG